VCVLAATPPPAAATVTMAAPDAMLDYTGKDAAATYGIIKERNKAAIIYATVGAEITLGTMLLAPQLTQTALMLTIGLGIMGYMGMAETTLDQKMLSFPGSRMLAGQYHIMAPPAPAA